jgi:hypothetical protein
MNRRSRGNTHGTIASKITVIRWFHRYDLGFEPPVDAGHALLMRGIRRCSAPVRKRQPVTPRMLRVIHGRCALHLPRERLVWGGLALAYFFLLRRSEYLLGGRSTKAYVLKLEDIAFFDTQGNRCRQRHAKAVGIRLRGAKNNQFGRLRVRRSYALPCARGTTRREGSAATQHEADRTDAANGDRVRDHSARHQRSRTRRSARGRGGRTVFFSRHTRYGSGERRSC